MATRQPLPFCMIGRARSPSDLYAAVSAIISLSASASASANAAWRFSNVRRSCSSKRRKSSAVSSISAETSLRKARTPHPEAAQQIRNCHPVIVAPLIVRRWMYRLCSGARAAMTGWQFLISSAGISCRPLPRLRRAGGEPIGLYACVRYSMKSCMRCLVTGPGVPSPTGRLSISVIGTISAAVPVAKHSSAT